MELHVLFLSLSNNLVSELKIFNIQLFECRSDAYFIKIQNFSFFFTYSKPTFRYSQLVQNEDDELIQEVDGYDPRPKSLRPYKDNSDEESVRLFVCFLFSSINRITAEWC